MSSNQPFSEWENVISINAMTMAPGDRLVVRSTSILIKGESDRGSGHGVPAGQPANVIAQSAVVHQAKEHAEVPSR
ncbi:hypothetical protein [Synechococcus sp. CBW1006]|uniref:hypothetical protein n=1 Tax=Synechococcus sp. CBW1006 TaxID=1353138 RepID=UPI0018CFB48D|nr:hypothetical protein [Synechococcus sp. CBW1006]QPN66447.1 hypothetical protein H8F26_17135 [Synechococcus sp. CBW1006]